LGVTTPLRAIGEKPGYLLIVSGRTDFSLNFIDWLFQLFGNNYPKGRRKNTLPEAVCKSEQAR